MLSSAPRHTHVLDSRRIAATRERTDFAFVDMSQVIATVFLVLPPDRLSISARWLPLLNAQALRYIAKLEISLEHRSLFPGSLPASGKLSGATSISGTTGPLLRPPERL